MGYFQPSWQSETTNLASDKSRATRPRKKPPVPRWSHLCTCRGQSVSSPGPIDGGGHQHRHADSSVDRSRFDQKRVNPPLAVRRGVQQSVAGLLDAPVDLFGNARDLAVVHAIDVQQLHYFAHALRTGARHAALYHDLVQRSFDRSPRLEQPMRVIRCGPQFWRLPVYAASSCGPRPQTVSVPTVASLLGALTV